MILLTGATGFLGRNLAPALVQAGRTEARLSRDTPRTTVLLRLNLA